VECIEISEHLPANLAQAFQYIWRAGLKGDAVEDYRKAAWYMNREARRLWNTKEPVEPIAPFRIPSEYGDKLQKVEDAETDSFKAAIYQLFTEMIGRPRVCIAVAQLVEVIWIPEDKRT
jgi:hypothetical protein